MLIGIDTSRANRREKTGVEWYAYHLIQHLQKIDEARTHDWDLYTDRPLDSGLEKRPSNWHERFLVWPPKYAWTQARLSYEMWRRPPQVLFIPVHVLPRVIPARTVVTVHDVGFYRHPELYTPVQNRYQRWSTQDILKRASAVMTVSEYSRQELLHFLPVDPKKVIVTPLGVDSVRYKRLSLERVKPVLAALKVPTPFFLYIGRLEAKKNTLLLIEAFHRYKTDYGLGDPYQLVLAGVPGQQYDQIGRALARSPVRDQIHVTGYVTEDQKIALLSSAAALIHPAWYEGFGLTPLEAMLCDCPVLCSRAASLPEVVGTGNALWFDPADAESLTHAMAQVVQHPEFCEPLRANGRAWASQFSWEETAAQTFQVLTNSSSLQ